MANFSPSIQFAKRWLGTPASARSAVYDELDDIIRLLDSSEPVSDFRFSHPDFNQAMQGFMQDGSSTNTQAMRLVHSLDTTSLDGEATATLTDNDLQALEARLNHNLSAQIDEFLGDHMSQLSDDLRAWLKTTIRNELANYQRQN
ncbi:hypothetical protein [uncultured Moraxella sp.]|uniref:hypothetical protein n=1 Tax=uncultured Moraxella sp. TaxID=263769 RepID=UPI0025CDE21C|nr:hypothetical protein [uncultured Moraxella sp.]